MSEISKRKADVTRDNILLKLDGKLKFLCHKRLSCFTKCCKDVNIYLTPYDVLRMKNRLKMESGEFLNTYTTTLIGEKFEFPVVALKMRDDEEKNCHFVTPEGCTIYLDRPWACRSYPLQPVGSRKYDKQGKEFYTIVRKPFCLGFDEDKQWTVKEWKEDQGIDIYLEMEKPFKEITLSERLQKEKIINEDIRQMFYMACYDLDRFRRFVFESKFLEIFDIEKEVVERMKTDDIELLKFGFKWVEFGLIRGDTLRIRKDVLQAKKKELESRIKNTGGGSPK